MNPIQNPFQLNAFHIRENGINSPPHANPNHNPRPIPQFGLSNQQFSPLATTFDITKHTLGFCSSQTLFSGDVRDMANAHRYQQLPDPQLLIDPLDDHNTSHVNEVENPHIHPVVPMSGVDGVEMSDNEDSMV